MRWLELTEPFPDKRGDFLQLSERTALAASAELLARARVALHRASGRKNDILHLEMQPDLARRLGYGAAQERGP